MSRFTVYSRAATSANTTPTWQRKLGYILAGGDLSQGQWMDEQYFLELEREAFLSLVGEKKTQDRIQYMLETNKPLRN